MWRWDQAEPFGSNPADEDPDANSVAFNLPLRLPGQRYDQETALHYNHFRDYDAAIGAYKQSDPLGLIAGINTYAYVDGAPLFHSDPLGLQKRGVPARPPLYPPLRSPTTFEPFTLNFGGPRSCGNCFTVYAVIPIRGTVRSTHRRSALQELEENLKQNPSLRRRLNQECGCDVLSQMRSGAGGSLINPRGFEFHHPIFPSTQTTSTHVWLIRTCDHRNPMYQDILHGLPGGRGGLGQQNGF